MVSDLVSGIAGAMFHHMVATVGDKTCHSACKIGSDAILVKLRLFCAD